MMEIPIQGFHNPPKAIWAGAAFPGFQTGDERGATAGLSRQSPGSPVLLLSQGPHIRAQAVFHFAIPGEDYSILLTNCKHKMPNCLLTNRQQRGILVTSSQQTGGDMGKQVGAYIRELREQRQASIRRVGNQIGLSPSYLSLVERGRREASISTLYPIVQALGGDMHRALILLARDAGVPAEALAEAGAKA